MKPFPARKIPRRPSPPPLLLFVPRREEGSLILRSHECRFKDAVAVAVAEAVGLERKGKNSRLILVAEGGGAECGFSGYKVRRGMSRRPRRMNHPLEYIDLSLEA